VKKDRFMETNSFIRAEAMPALAAQMNVTVY
jgi:hypothetical protein